MQKSKWFTPSTIGNVIIADTENHVYLVSEKGDIREFQSTVSRENRRLFLDRLKDYNPSLVGTIEPKDNDVKSNHAQWLGGIAAGAWFEIHDLNSSIEYRFRRISPYGNVDADGIYKVTSKGFQIDLDYKFIHYSNCLFYHVDQNSTQYRFEFLDHFKD